jgi:hypothetical protein
MTAEIAATPDPESSNALVSPQRRNFVRMDAIASQR